MNTHLRVLHTHHGLSKGLLNQVDTALVHRLTVGQEATLQSSGYRRQTLRKPGRRVDTVSGLSMQCYHHRTWTHPTDSLSTKRFAQVATAHQTLTSNKGKRSLSSSFSWFHFWISGGINI